MTDLDKEQQIEHLLQTNEEFRLLHDEHHRLAVQVDELSKRRNRSDFEQKELQRLKKEKLRVKDTMGRIMFDDEMNQGSA
ncbi:MAG: YdcH family protein [Desulfuromonadales bacterium]|nr:YdcH family protein [Desulfuromonadales bacterium]